MTYPLQDTWVIWEHRVVTDNGYNSASVELAEFSSVDDFFKYIKHIPFPSNFFYTRGGERSKLGGRDVVGFSCFKKGILPCWEDPQNINGAEWRIRKFKTLEDVDTAWVDIIMLAIGNTSGNDITGVRVVDSSNLSQNKQMYNVEIWFSNTDDYSSIENILTDDLRIDISKMYYRVHSQAKEGLTTPKIQADNLPNIAIKDKNLLNNKSNHKHNKKHHGKRNGNNDRKNNRKKTPTPDRNATAIN